MEVLALVLLLGKRQLRLMNRLAQLHQARQAHLKHWEALYYVTKNETAHIVCLGGGGNKTNVLNKDGYIFCFCFWALHHKVGNNVPNGGRVFARNPR